MSGVSYSLAPSEVRDGSSGSTFASRVMHLKVVGEIHAECFPMMLERMLGMMKMTSRIVEVG